MKINRNYLWVFIFILISSQTNAQENSTKYDVFSFTFDIVLPGSPDKIYDNITGDISGWWDHSFSEKPDSFFIEPFPGGGFYEYFDNMENGVKHATVLVAQRGKMLRFDGPLGLSGKAIQLVSTFELEQTESDSTKLTLTVNAAGQIDDGIDKIVERVWRHFIFDRLKPFIENEGKIED